jgi:hypothetical protein
MSADTGCQAGSRGPATRSALSEWIGGLAQRRIAAMEATFFTGWIYDFLKPHADAVKVAQPEMLKAITAAKKKNDRLVFGYGPRLQMDVPGITSEFK